MVDIGKSGLKMRKKLVEFLSFMITFTTKLVETWVLMVRLRWCNIRA